MTVIKSHGTTFVQMSSMQTIFANLQFPSNNGFKILVKYVKSFESGAITLIKSNGMTSVKCSSCHVKNFLHCILSAIEYGFRDTSKKK